jgi:hypothetical protein
MTTDTQTPEAVHRDALDRTVADTSVMPRHVRGIVWGCVTIAVAFATYLMMVRGEAMLFDLPAAAARLFCL